MIIHCFDGLLANGTGGSAVLRVWDLLHGAMGRAVRMALERDYLLARVCAGTQDPQAARAPARRT